MDNEPGEKLVMNASFMYMFSSTRLSVICGITCVQMVPARPVARAGAAKGLKHHAVDEAVVYHL